MPFLLWMGLWLVGLLLVVGIIACPDQHKLLYRANVMLLDVLPELMGKVLRKVLGERVFNFFDSIRVYVFYKPNPIMQIMYLLLICGGFYAFFYEGYPRLPNMFMGEWHKLSVIALCIACLASFFVASGSDPGVITKENFALYDTYPYDNVIFTHKECRTCLFRKVARSKHCSVCDHCVAKYDHHCVWINKCVGERNYRWFMTFLAVHCFTLLYGAVALSCMLASEVLEKDLLNATFYHPKNPRRPVKAGYAVVLQFLFFRHNILIALLILAGVMGVVLGGFIVYHLKLIAYGTSTNESIKWKEYLWRIGRDRRIWEDRKEGLEKESKQPLTGEEIAKVLFGWCSRGSLTQKIGPKPTAASNVYDWGIKENFRQVFFPLSTLPFHLRPKMAVTKVATSATEKRKSRGTRRRTAKKE